MPFEKSRLLWELTWNAGWVTAVSFVGDTRRLVAGNRIGQMLEWELPEDPAAEAPRPDRQYAGHTNAITRIVSTRDGSALFSASFDHTLRKWNPAAEPTGEGKVILNERAIFEAERRRQKTVPEPDELALPAIGSSESLGGHSEWINAMELSHDESLLVSGDDGGSVVIRDRESGQPRAAWQIEGWVHALALSPDNGRAVISERRPLVFDSGQHRGIRLWDVAAEKPIADLSKDYPKMYLSAAAWSPDGNTVAVGRGEEANGTIWLLDPAEDCKKVKELSPHHRYGVTDFLFHPDGKHLFSAGRDTVIRIWDIDSGELVGELGEPRGAQFKDWIHAISLSADATVLAAADMAGQVNVWKLG